MKQVHGLHHVTAIAGDPQTNLDFYAGVLGMRLVKRSVNQDDPGTYHLFYADASGSPGTDLTFFPWIQLAPSHQGAGLIMEVALAVESGTLDFWKQRLVEHGVEASPIERRFGEPTLPFVDPHGLRVALVETAGRAFQPWARSPVPAERQIRGLHAVRMWERDVQPSVEFAREALGWTPVGEEASWQRFGVGGNLSGQIVELRSTPDLPRGRWGVGSVHHVAFRVSDDAEQIAVRAQAEHAGARPTPVIDRFWFKSVYFREPGGVLYELATDGPGFAVDEDPAALGETLILPPWLERQRGEIEGVLPPLRYPVDAPR